MATCSPQNTLMKGIAVSVLQLRLNNTNEQQYPATVITLRLPASSGTFPTHPIKDFLAEKSTPSLVKMNLFKEYNSRNVKAH